MSKWNFPGNGSGQVKGIEDPAIVNFNGNKLKALAREICQNSLDAIREGETETKVEFIKYEIKSTEIPGYEEYREIIEKSRVYWKKANSEKSDSFLDNLSNIISLEKSYVLRISDFNTTGLLGPYDKINCFTIWNSLTKVDGGATKNGDKGGSHGIGKNAPFSNSDYRMVFYRTLNADNERAAQGISRWISFPQDSNNPIATMTTGIGYYGNNKDNGPIKEITELENICKRNEIGTDVFVYGLNISQSDDWANEMCVEVLDNFLVAIYRNQLSVKIGKKVLNKSNLDNFMKALKSQLKHSYSNYLVLTEKSTELKKSFHGMGTLKLKILIDPNLKLNKKILITRKSGMKLFNLGNISSAISFSGILELEGEELNKYFREMETAAHDSWKPKLHPKYKEALAYFTELKDWIRDSVLKLGENTSDEEIEIEGLGNVLQQKENDALKSSDEKSEGLNNNLGDIVITKRAKTISSKGFLFGNKSKKSSSDNGSNGNSNKSSMKTMDGKVSKDGTNAAVRSLGGIRKRAKKDSHKGVPESGGHDKIYISQGGGDESALTTTRIIKKDSSKYLLSFTLPRAVEKGNIELVTVGENGRSTVLKISLANAVKGCKEVKVVNEKIYVKGIAADEKVKIEFSLVDNRNYAMEMNIYENN